MKKLSVLSIVVAILLTFVIVPNVHAAGQIFLDGIFTDWTGQPFIVDPAGDNKAAGADLLNFYFVAGDDEVLYFMFERAPSNQKITIAQNLDLNNNEIYTDYVDRVIYINYDPGNDDSRVNVDVYDGAGVFVGNVATGADWGESKNEGAARVEWGVSFELLGLVTGQTLNINMTFGPGQGQGNTNGDELDFPIQWSPASVLGWPVLLIVLLAGTGALVFRQYQLEKRRV